MFKFIKNAKPIDWKIGNDVAMVFGGLFTIVTYVMNLKDDVAERRQLAAAELGESAEEQSEDTDSAED